MAFGIFNYSDQRGRLAVFSGRPPVNSHDVIFGCRFTAAWIDQWFTLVVLLTMNLGHESKIHEVDLQIGYRLEDFFLMPAIQTEAKVGYETVKLFRKFSQKLSSILQILSLKACHRPAANSSGRLESMEGRLDVLVLNGTVGKRHFQNDASLISPERAMQFSGRTARIVAGLKPPAKRVIVQTAADDEYLLRVGMSLAAERRRIGVRQEPGQSCVFAGNGVNAQVNSSAKPSKPFTGVQRSRFSGVRAFQ